MTDEHKKQKTADSNTINIVAAGIAGVIAGGAAVAATVLMSDKNNQKKAKEALTDVKEKVTKYMDTVKKQPMVQKSTDKVGEAVRKVKDIVT
jgi:flagellar basal body-associated protein FliL